MRNVMLETPSPISSMLRLQDAATRLNPGFFIVGFPFSGTRRVANLLDSHPQLTVAPELNWITYFFDTPKGPNLEGLLAWPLVAKWLYQRKFEPFAISSEDLQRIIAPSELLPCHLFVRRILDLYGKIEGKKQVGSWTPEFMPFLVHLHEF